MASPSCPRYDASVYIMLSPTLHTVLTVWLQGMRELIGKDADKAIDDLF